MIGPSFQPGICTCIPITNPGALWWPSPVSLPVAPSMWESSTAKRSTWGYWRLARMDKVLLEIFCLTSCHSRIAVQWDSPWGMGQKVEGFGTRNYSGGCQSVLQIPRNASHWLLWGVGPHSQNRSALRQNKRTADSARRSCRNPMNQQEPPAEQSVLG